MNQILAYLLFLVGKYLLGRGVETFNDYLEDEKRKKKIRKAIVELKEAVKKGDVNEIRKKELDLLNGGAD